MFCAAHVAHKDIVY